MQYAAAATKKMPQYLRDWGERSHEGKDFAAKPFFFLRWHTFMEQSVYIKYGLVINASLYRRCRPSENRKSVKSLKFNTIRLAFVFYSLRFSLGHFIVRMHP